MLSLVDYNGEIQHDMLPDVLPYDIAADSIDLKPEDCGIGFVDCMENPERYIGKKITFAGMVLKRRGMPSNEFIPGRMAMTCCAQDMTFLGCVTKGDPSVIAPYNTRDWAKLTATVSMEEREEYSGEGPVLELESIVRTGPIDDVVTF